MSGHEKAGPDSRKLCDSLFAEMVGLHPGIVRDELAGSCALYQPGNNRFAYMFHSSQPRVYVFVRNATAFHKSSLQKGVTISLQQEGEESINYHRGAMLPDGVTEAWQEANNRRGKKTIRYSLKLVSPNAVHAVASILLNEAYPL